MTFERNDACLFVCYVGLGVISDYNRFLSADIKRWYTDICMK